jgi:uracil phosphoribosyltransferase
MLTILEHPLLEHKMTLLRDKKTGTKEVRELVGEISIELVFEALKDAKLGEIEIETPMSKAIGKKLDEDNYCFIPILRAGTGMLDGVIKVMPNAKIGHIGIFRNPDTLEAIQYYFKVPKNINKREILVLDPILATGGSAVAAIQMLKEAGGKKIKFLSLLASPEGVKAVEDAHPDVKIYTTLMGDLNEDGYIPTGFGDAGDRIFGTK